MKIERKIFQYYNKHKASNVTNTNNKPNSVQFSVASVFAVSLARDASLSAAMDQQANVQLIKARRLDSQAQTTKKLNTKRFISERRS